MQMQIQYKIIYRYIENGRTNLDICRCKGLRETDRNSNADTVTKTD